MLTCLFEDGKKVSLRHVVADALVLKDGKILLAKRTGKILEGGKWGLIGGFVERDETIQQAITREVLEESGYTIDNLTLLTILDRPDRPREDRQNINFIFCCDAKEKTGSGDWESDDQRWFDFDDLPEEKEIAFDHFQSIQTYLNFKKTGVAPLILGSVG